MFCLCDACEMHELQACSVCKNQDGHKVMRGKVLHLDTLTYSYVCMYDAQIESFCSKKKKTCTMLQSFFFVKCHSLIPGLFDRFKIHRAAVNLGHRRSLSRDHIPVGHCGMWTRLHVTADSHYQITGRLWSPKQWAVRTDRPSAPRHVYLAEI